MKKAIQIFYGLLGLSVAWAATHLHETLVAALCAFFGAYWLFRTIREMAEE